MTQKSDPDIDKSQDLLYTISEVAALLKVNRNYVYKLINKGYLRSIKLGCRKVTKKIFASVFRAKRWNEL